jgi:hypothetical protein
MSLAARTNAGNSSTGWEGTDTTTSAALPGAAAAGMHCIQAERQHPQGQHQGVGCQQQVQRRNGSICTHGCATTAGGLQLTPHWHSTGSCSCPQLCVLQLDIPQLLRSQAECCNPASCSSWRLWHCPPSISLPVTLSPSPTLSHLFWGLCCSPPAAPAPPVPTAPQGHCGSQRLCP